jgi:hypothetical protein
VLFEVEVVVVVGLPTSGGMEVELLEPRVDMSVPLAAPIREMGALMLLGGFDAE